MKVLRGKKIDQVWHLAANSDIPAGIEDMNVDLEDTFMSTVSTLKIMKSIKCKKLFLLLALLFMALIKTGFMRILVL